MSEAKHTPGPWRVSERGERTPYTEICVINAPGGEVEIITDNESSDTIADARLIAAAPEMYEALTAMLHRFEIYCGGPDNPYGGHTDGELLNRARSAIAKAEGTPTEQ